ncbi:MAG: ATP-binding protein [Solirubrobacteraceae bacterium]
MGADVRADELTVLCPGCSNPVRAGARCPACGDAGRSPRAQARAEDLDEALLGQVGAALAAQATLARRTASARMREAAGTVEDTIVLRGRLRRQRALLRERAAERGQLLPRLRDALHQVDEALAQPRTSGSAAVAWSLRAQLPRDRSCAIVARRLVEGHARDDLDDRQIESAMLIASELATNALLHGVGQIVLIVSRHADRLRIEITDQGRPRHLAVVPEGRRGIGGRGLWIVEQLATAWGTTDGTARVWAELALT